MEKVKNQTTSRGTKYYRVMLNGIDPHKETLDTFALKLSMQTRAPITRINNIMRNLPAAVKSGLDLTQATKFSAVLAELGGNAAIEAYYLRPGESHKSWKEKQDSQQNRQRIQSASADARGELHGSSDRMRICSSCGWENPQESDHCEFCHGTFVRNTQAHVAHPKEQLSEENPLNAPDKKKPRDITLWSIIARHKISFLVGLNILLIYILLSRN
ncbi:MAG: hypothetical protein ABIA59_04975 [Candidatus Latescibacterota bacterium]